jgi:hypothetical protein
MSFNRGSTVSFLDRSHLAFSERKKKPRLNPRRHERTLGFPRSRPLPEAPSCEAIMHATTYN